MKLEVGMYVRTKQGIGKIDETRMFLEKYFEFHLDSNKGYTHNVSDNTYWNDKENVIGEPSSNIMDLIEVGDYVNGYLVYEILEYKDNTRAIVIGDDSKSIIWEESSQYIKSIVTKEMFSSISYEVSK